jgi:fructoselysine-6-P-deglycase FrlB-like protein
VSPLVAATAVGAHLARRPRDDALLDGVRDLLAAGLDRGPMAESVAARLADRRQVIAVASGADRPAGRELVLKIEEGTWIPAAYRDLETFLHGHLAAVSDADGLVLVLADRDRRPERLARAAGVLRAARVIGMEAAAILATDVAAELPTELTPAGRIVIPEAPHLPAPVAALLTERLARARGVDPDPIHRDVDRYREAADAAD